MPVRDLFAGEWPGAKRFDVRVSLLALNKAGEVTGNYISACSYTNGILRVAGLPAGDYRLTLRDRGSESRLSVAKTAANPVAGGVVAGLSRSLTDTGNPNLLRIASAAFDKRGALTVRLANATSDARIHVVAARTRERLSAYAPDCTRGARSPRAPGADAARNTCRGAILATSSATCLTAATSPRASGTCCSVRRSSSRHGVRRRQRPRTSRSKMERTGRLGTSLLRQ